MLGYLLVVLWDHAQVWLEGVVPAECYQSDHHPENRKRESEREGEGVNDKIYRRHYFKAWHTASWLVNPKFEWLGDYIYMYQRLLAISTVVHEHSSIDSRWLVWSSRASPPWGWTIGGAWTCTCLPPLLAIPLSQGWRRSPPGHPHHRELWTLPSWHSHKVPVCVCVCVWERERDENSFYTCTC